MKILFLAANPESTSRLNLAEEAQEIQDAIDSSELSSEFELIQKWEVRPKDFRRALLKHQPDIVHFSGHGSGKTGLIIANDAGESKQVSGDALAGLFAAFPMVKCVLLNACYAEVQARTIVEHVDYVIGMKDTIYDKAARAFSIGFYDSLGYGRNFEEAFALGSNAILWEYDNTTGQTRDEPRKLIPVESVLSKLPEHLKPILLCKDSIVVPETKTISISSEQDKPNGKQIFLERVQKYVIQRRLTPIAKFQLNNFAKEQGLSQAEANSILDAEISKIEQAKQNYQELLEATIADGLNPLDPANQQELKSL
ncbi:MAG: CHAT domain-containing protein, partial [Xenococcus sp. (in: cyanobacteria)]